MINFDAFKPSALGSTQCGKGWVGIKGKCRRSTASGKGAANRLTAKQKVTAMGDAQKVRAAKGKSRKSAIVALKAQAADMKERATMKGFGTPKLNEENTARLSTLRRRQAAKQKLKASEAGSDGGGRTFAAKAASGKGVKGMNVVAPKGYSVSEEQEITRSTQKHERDFQRRKANAKKRKSA